MRLVSLFSVQRAMDEAFAGRSGTKLSSWQRDRTISANLSVPISVRIDVFRDDEAKVYFATNETLGLAVESETLDSLMSEIHLALPELLELAHKPLQNSTSDIRIHQGLAPA